jgi:hypothetical protein
MWSVSAAAGHPNGDGEAAGTLPQVDNGADVGNGAGEDAEVHPASPRTANVTPTEHTKRTRTYCRIEGRDDRLTKIRAERHFGPSTQCGDLAGRDAVSHWPDP